ncbi:MAG: hypothetical protein Q9160_004318 [Pyrenula sp. 1 TL-2023]
MDSSTQRPQSGHGYSRSSQSYFQSWNPKDQQDSARRYSYSSESVSPGTALPPRPRPNVRRTDSYEINPPTHLDLALPTSPLAGANPLNLYAKRKLSARRFGMGSISESPPEKESRQPSPRSSTSSLSQTRIQRGHSSDVFYSASSRRPSAAQRSVLRTSIDNRRASSSSSISISTPTRTVATRSSAAYEHNPRGLQRKKPSSRASVPNAGRSSKSGAKTPPESPPILTPLRGPAPRPGMPPSKISGARVVLESDFSRRDTIAEPEPERPTERLHETIRVQRGRVFGKIRHLFRRPDTRPKAKEAPRSPFMLLSRSSLTAPKLISRRSARATIFRQQTKKIAGQYGPDAITTETLERVSLALEHLGKQNAVYQPEGERQLPSQVHRQDEDQPRKKHSITHSLADSYSSSLMAKRIGQMPQATPSADATYKQPTNPLPPTFSTPQVRVKISSSRNPSFWQTQEHLRVDITDPNGPSYLPSEARRIRTPKSTNTFASDDGDRFYFGRRKGTGKGRDGWWDYISPKYREVWGRGTSENGPKREGEGDGDGDENENETQGRREGHSEGKIVESYRYSDTELSASAASSITSTSASTPASATTGRGDDATFTPSALKQGAGSLPLEPHETQTQGRATATARENQHAADDWGRKRRLQRERERVPDHLPGSPLCPGSERWWYRDRGGEEGARGRERVCPVHGARKVEGRGNWRGEVGGEGREEGERGGDGGRGWWWLG